MDVATHEKCGYRFAIIRKGRSAGKIVATFCSRCGKMFKAQAGQPKEQSAASRSTDEKL